jgi:hypothetical protein
MKAEFVESLMHLIWTDEHLLFWEKGRGWWWIKQDQGSARILPVAHWEVA